MVNFQFVMLVFQRVVTDIEYPRFAGALFPKPNNQRWVISAQQKTRKNMSQIKTTTTTTTTNT